MKDYNWVKNRFGTRMANILRGLRKEVFDISENNDAKFKDTEGREYNVLTTQALHTKGSEAEQAFSTILANKSLIEVKWAELKDLRDTSKLIPGSLYRITDYQCTTTQTDTLSAGNQFDIVLLALSENKLAEEGWAMMNESNIYDVTFDSGIVEKCYFYPYDEDYCHVVSVNSGLGMDTGFSGMEIDEANKTINAEDFEIESLDTPDLTYNYFQNSNLSAWKVWYCLDNDKSRFAWADDANKEWFMDNGYGYRFYRNKNADELGKFAWTTDKLDNDNDQTIYTNTTTPKVGEMTYEKENNSFIENDTICEVHGFGRGVIYRLIDEWNNDVCYDFKNILFARPISGGEYTPDGGSEKFVYTFNATTANNDCSDLTLHNGEEADGNYCHCCNNVILPRINGDGLGYMLNIATFIVYHDVDDEVIGACEDNTLKDVYDFVGASDIIGVQIYGSRFIFVNEGTYNSIILSAYGKMRARLSVSGTDVIYIKGKKVLTQT